MEQENLYKSSYILRVLSGDYNPFRPNIIVINNSFIEFKKRNWHLISVDTQTFHFQSVVGIDVDKHLIGASLKIATSGNERIYVNGFSKKSANMVKRICSEYISANSQRGTSESLAGAIAKAVGSSARTSNYRSVADELTKMKALLDSGVLTQEEFDIQKTKILNR